MFTILRYQYQTLAYMATWAAQDSHVWWKQVSVAHSFLSIDHICVCVGLDMILFYRETTKSGATKYAHGSNGCRTS